LSDDESRHINDFSLSQINSIKSSRKPIVIKFILGGEEILIEYAGKECTEAFDDVGHSSDAKEILKTYHIGTIVESERAANKKKKDEAKK
jgi:hypothetical protein